MKVKNSNQKLTKFQVDCTIGTRDEIKLRAREVGISMSAFVRMTILTELKKLKRENKSD